MIIYEVGRYDNTVGNHTYAQYTKGIDYVAVYQGKTYAIGIRFGKENYLQKISSPAEEYAWKEVAINEVPNMVLANIAEYFKLDNEIKVPVRAESQNLEEENVKKKEFARMCSRKARKYGISFSVALAFKGDDDAIQAFVDSLKEAINNKLSYEANELMCGRARSSAEMKKLGIDIGQVDANKINNYVLDCLKSSKIINE